MLYRDGELRGKPASAEAARRGGSRWPARPAQLYTGHCVIRIAGQHDCLPCCRRHRHHSQFRHPVAADLDAYVASGEPTAVAGGFTLDGLGGWFVDGVDGDPSTVIGIGLPLLRSCCVGAVGARTSRSAELWAAIAVTW